MLTVCYGSTTDVRTARYYTLEECKFRLDRDMMAAIEQVDRCIPSLPERPLAAFADAVYNMGPTIACNTKQSTAARHLKAGNIIAACNQLPRWNKSKIAGGYVELPGLTNRLEAERQLCLS
ncbi:glycoside hydrolase family protein [Methylobacillus gramineus]|nr:glycoside hydrolase family protein [Methylobacillus gramineus]MCB5184463.1 glycoside hydrolase family protein [Methylobacillus gramineus]